MEVIIMRGIPGAGKDHWIRSFVEQQLRETDRKSWFVASADHYFMQKDEYVFIKELLGQAHNFCLRAYLDALQGRNGNWDGVIVNNTNITAHEISPYYRLAELFGSPVKIVEIQCSPLVASKRNVHGVPPETIGAMWANLLSERLPPWWSREVVK